MLDIAYMPYLEYRLLYALCFALPYFTPLEPCALEWGLATAAASDCLQPTAVEWAGVYLSAFLDIWIYAHQLRCTAFYLQTLLLGTQDHRERLGREGCASWCSRVPDGDHRAGRRRQAATGRLLIPFHSTTSTRAPAKPSQERSELPVSNATKSKYIQVQRATAPR